MRLVKAGVRLAAAAASAPSAAAAATRCHQCSIPLAANVAVATMVYERGPSWWVAGVAGAIVAAVWNYVTTSRAVW